MKFLPAAAAAALILAGRLQTQESSPQPGQKPPADHPGAETNSQGYVFTARSDLVFLPTQVQNRKGETIYGLKPEQFVVEDNGVRQSVRIEEDPESVGLSLVVVVQCSRSADKEFNKYKGLSAMIEGIVGGAPHEVAVISYGEAIYTLGNFSSNPDAVGHAVAKIQPCGDFNAITIDAVNYAVHMLQRRQNRYRHAILLISEGRDHGSRSKLDEVVAELGITDAVIYTETFAPAKDEFIRTFRFGGPDALPPSKTARPSPTARSAPVEDSSSESSAEPPEKDPVYLVHPPIFSFPPDLMMAVNALRHSAAPELAALSGGDSLRFTTRKGFEDGLERISNQIHNYYLLSFRPPSAPSFGLHALRVRVPDFPDAVIQTRRSYWSGILPPQTTNSPPEK